MPTYEYRCKDCGTELEVVQSFTDDALTTCEACGGRLRKVFGSVGISFKGSGFYKTDSRSSSGSKSSSSSSTGDGCSSSTSGDSGSSSSSTSDGASKGKDSSKKGESTSSTPAASTT